MLCCDTSCIQLLPLYQHQVVWKDAASTEAACAFPTKGNHRTLWRSCSRGDPCLGMPGLEKVSVLSPLHPRQEGLCPWVLTRKRSLSPGQLTSWELQNSLPYFPLVEGDTEVSSSSRAEVKPPPWGRFCGCPVPPFLAMLQKEPRAPRCQVCSPLSFTQPYCGGGGMLVPYPYMHIGGSQGMQD